MNDFVCRRLMAVKNSISDQLGKDESYQIIINNTILNNYCTNNKCSSNLEKINAGCLYLFDALFKDYSVFKNHNNINIVEYILIWLSYMLNLKEHVGATNLQYFYNVYIQGGDKYKNTITDVAGYTNYKDLIDQKIYFLNMDSNIISNFYEAFKLLCEMYIEFDESKPNCEEISEKARQFVEKYKELNEDSSITENSSYSQVLCTLSSDYDNLKNKCKHFPLLQEIKTTQLHAQSPAHNSAQGSKQLSTHGSEQLSTHGSEQLSEQRSTQGSEVTSPSSSIGNKLFTVLSIFGAIAFFLGISYKYSLFGLRKRAQKQHLREKIKNIKRINY
ncbi:BIR protein [Plasmodium berghei]|uniref:BIR protein n=1 Tax=Plasmodium berghei TaxID=5821 RepID=A0A1D3L6G8_PLABE|nr:BIR protein [Plasmodium berghei]